MTPAPDLGSTRRSASGFVQRLRDERGSGLVAGMALIFALTFGGVVWLAHDVDRSISNRSTAGSIAFQSARAGAQAAAAPDLRAGSAPRLDGAAADAAARRTALRLFDSYGVIGSVEVAVGHHEVRTLVTIVDGGRSVTGSATVRAERAP